MAPRTDKFSGYIFICSGRTKPDCYRYRVFGLPAGRLDVVKKIRPHRKLFLFDFELKLLYGIYTATSCGGLGIEPAAFEGKFPAQVKFDIFKECCLPLPESVLRQAIKDNYNGGLKFRQELSDHQIPHAWGAHLSTQSVPLAAIRINSYIQAEGDVPCHLNYLTVAPNQARYGQRDDHQIAVLMPGGADQTTLQLAAVAHEDRRHASAPESMELVALQTATLETGGSGDSAEAKNGNKKLAFAHPSLNGLNHLAALHGTMHSTSLSSCGVEYAKNPQQVHSDSHHEECSAVDVPNSCRAAIDSRISELVRSLHENMVQSSRGTSFSHYDATSSYSHALPSNQCNMPSLNCYMPSDGIFYTSFSPGASAYWTGAVPLEIQAPNLVSSIDQTRAASSFLNGPSLACVQVPVQDPAAVYGPIPSASSIEVASATATTAFVNPNQAYYNH